MIKHDELYELYVNQGMTQKAIADKLGCSRRNIGNYLNKYDIPKRSRTASNNNKVDISAREIVQRMKMGEALNDIAKQVGAHRNTLSKILSRAGYNMRNHRAQRERQSQRLKKDNPLYDDEVKQRATANSSATRKAKHEMYHKEFDVTMSKEMYIRKARAIAYERFGRGTPDGMEIDHLYSVKDGYNNKVPLFNLSHPNNLRLITVEENKAKHASSIITLDQLYELTDGKETED